MEEAIQGIAATAESFAGKKTVEQVGEQGLRKVHEEFGKRADALSLRKDGGIPHVYEYGMEGQKVGRLWRAPITGTGDKRSVDFFFTKSVTTVPLPEAAERDAAERGFERAEHIWADKATDQEYTRVFQIRAGGPAPTRVSPGTSEWLLIYNGRGEPMYKKTWRNYSPYVGNFRAFFETFWNVEPSMILEREAEYFLETKFKSEVEREVQAQIISGRHSGQRLVPSVSPVTITVKGTPRKINDKPSRSLINKLGRSMRRMYQR